MTAGPVAEAAGCGVRVATVEPAVWAAPAARAGRGTGIAATTAGGIGQAGGDGGAGAPEGRR
ncbi:hypothetical protein MMRN_57590 [Mycobacterium marinum]|nr:hypothetical protein MMRN_57590 [Mycobacterium marinum]